MTFKASFLHKKIELNDVFIFSNIVSPELTRNHPVCIMCVQYIGGCSVHQGDNMSTSVDIMSAS